MVDGPSERPDRLKPNDSWAVALNSTLRKSAEPATRANHNLRERPSSRNGPAVFLTRSIGVCLDFRLCVCSNPQDYLDACRNIRIRFTKTCDSGASDTLAMTTTTIPWSGTIRKSAPPPTEPPG